MSLSVICACGKKLKVKDQLAGRRAKCPACGNVLTIPHKQTESADPIFGDAPGAGASDGLNLGSLAEMENAGDPLSHAFGGDPLPGSYQHQVPAVTQGAVTEKHSAETHRHGPDTDGGWAGFWQGLAGREVPARKRAIVFGGIGAALVTFIAGCGIGAIFLFIGVSSVLSGRGKLFELQGHNGDVRTVAISPNGKIAATSGMDGTTRLWSMDDGSALHTLDFAAADLAFSPDGRTLATAGGKTVVLWSASSAEKQRELKLREPSVAGPKSDHTGWTVAYLAFSPDGNTLAASSDAIGGMHPSSHGTAIWDLNAEEEGPQRIIAARGCLAFSPDGNILASGGGAMVSPEGATAGVVALFDTATWEKLRELRASANEAAHPNGLTASLAFSPDGKTLASGSSDTEALVAGTPGLNKNRACVRLWEMPSGRLLRTISGDMKQHLSLAFRPNGKSLLVAGGNPFPTMKDGAVREYDVATGKAIATIVNKSFVIQAAALSSDGKRLLIACNNAGGEADRRVYDRIRERNRGAGAPEEPRAEGPPPQDVFVEVWGLP